MAFLPVLTKLNKEEFIERVIQTCDFIDVIVSNDEEIRMTTTSFSIATSLLDSLTEFCTYSDCSCLSNNPDKAKRVWEITGYYN